MNKEYLIGDRIEYKKISDRFSYWLPGVVVGITTRRVVIRLDGSPNIRNVLQQHLRREE